LIIIQILLLKLFLLEKKARNMIKLKRKERRIKEKEQKRKEVKRKKRK
jgi:hypothetical protein